MVMKRHKRIAASATTYILLNNCTCVDYFSGILDDQIFHNSKQ